MPKLKNKKHERLVQEYLIDLNQTYAAIRAGYSPKSANQQSAELFAKPSIRARVDKLMAERATRVGITKDRVIRELALSASSPPVKVVSARYKTNKRKRSGSE